MASDAKTTEISTVSLKSMRAPEMFPRGSSGDPQLDDMRSRLQDNFDIITNYFNNVVNTTIENIVNVGFGGLDNTCRVIATTTPGLVLLGNVRTGGNDTLKLTADGQLIFCWMERITASNTVTFYAKKAISPFLVWTSLDGTTQDATQVVQVSGVIAADSPVFVEDATTGSLHFFCYTANGANFEIRDMILPRSGTDATAWTTGSYAVVCQSNASSTIQQSSSLIKVGDAISAASGVYFIGGTGANDVGQVFRYVGGVWRAVKRYYSPLGGASALDGEQKRLIDMGDGRILALMESSNGTNIGIASAIFNETDPNYDPALGVQPRINSDGWFLPIATSPFRGSGNGGAVFCTWSAARIAGTSRIGVTFLSVTLAASGSQPAGTYYTEFNGTTNAWKAQADIMRLSSGDVDFVAAAPNVLSSIVSAARFNDLGGKCLFGTGGIPRVLWVQGMGEGTTGNASRVNGFAYRRLKDGGTPETETDWYTQREVYSMSGVSSELGARKSEFMGGRNLVTIGSSTYAPIAWTRSAAPTGGGSHSTEFCFKLLPVTLMDLP